MTAPSFPVSALIEHDRVYFKVMELQTQYTYAYQFEAKYEPVSEGSICHHCGTAILILERQEAESEA